MISNSTEYAMVIGAACSRALDYTLERAYKALSQSMDTVIYNANSAGSYQRSNSILDAWKVEHAKNFGLAFSGEINYNSARMDNDPANWVHGSEIGGGENRDVRAYILDIIHDGYFAYGNKDGKLIKARGDVWKHFMSKFDKNFDRWFIAGLRKQGLTAI